MASDLLRRVPAAHFLAAALCAGLALALLGREAHAGLALSAGAAGLLAVVITRARVPLLALALVLAGLWWGSVRLDALDASVLENEVGRAALARVEVTGPARRSEFAVRVPVRVLRFGREELDEGARLDLPPERAPPQGSLLEVVVTVARPRGPEAEGGFDEAAYLRRQGIHVVLRGGSFRVVGRRGGLGAVADRLRRGVARSLEAVPPGERRAVLAGVVLGEDEGLDQELRDRFRASGLYHLLSSPRPSDTARQSSSGFRRGEERRPHSEHSKLSWPAGWATPTSSAILRGLCRGSATTLPIEEARRDSGNSED